MLPDDILGIGKVLPMDKLLDVLSKGVGRLSKSYFDRKDVDTRAYEIRKLAEAKADEVSILATAIKNTLQISDGIEYKDDKFSITPSPTTNKDTQDNVNTISLNERTLNRVSYQESKGQLNIENITAFAAEALQGEQTVTDEPVDENWINRFFRIAEDISDEEMQSLWGRILAGEIKQPKSYSLRALDLLKNLSKDEAEIFTKFAKLALIVDDITFIFNPDDFDFLNKQYGFKYEELLLLEEIGLINTNILDYTLTNFDKVQTTAFIYGDYAVILEKGANTPEQNIPLKVFTRVGSQLVKLIKQQLDITYLNQFSELLIDENIKISYGEIITISKNRIEFRGAMVELPQ